MRWQGVAYRAHDPKWAWAPTSGEGAAGRAVAERFSADGASGILVPSFARAARPEAVNLVLWRRGAALPRQVMVYDPTQRLPRNPAYWSVE